MTANTRIARLAAALLLGTSLAAASGAGAAETSKWPGTRAGEAAPRLPGVPPELAKNLANFDDLDFRVYTNQQWQDLHKSHAKDVVVHWPDGHTTQGIEKHIEDLKYMWTFAPDNRIGEHPVRFGTPDGEWTAVTGWLEGTFTKPMVLPGGKSIAPTGKAYRIPMATIGHWKKDGTMSEEYLFWDNGEFMKQIGVGS
jgi:SnoaL-like polyketide cyclase